MDAEIKFSAIGDTGILIYFGNRIDETLHQKVCDLFEKIKNKKLSFIIDIVPAYSSIALFYNLKDVKNKYPQSTSTFENVKQEVESILREELTFSKTSSRKIKIPVCYADKFALDIKEISKEKNIAVDEIIRLHTSKTYKIYMIGFLPGFPYMGEVDERIAMPRRSIPRITVPAGSVGIAGIQTGIYPLESPGGWQIIGKTPYKLFDKEKSEPVLLQPGDEIEFYSITEDEFTNY